MTVSQVVERGQVSFQLGDADLKDGWARAPSKRGGGGAEVMQAYRGTHCATSFMR